MSQKHKIITGAYWTTTLLTLAAAVAVLFSYTPDEATMGPVQKTFYLHLPLAINTFNACLVCFVASIGYLATRDTWWDDLAAASAKVAVLLCTGVLITGMIWGKSAWGQWWTWSPRLTFSFMLWLLYVVYLLLARRFGAFEHLERDAARAAFAPGAVEWADLPLPGFEHVDAPYWYAHGGSLTLENLDLYIDLSKRRARSVARWPSPNLGLTTRARERFRWRVRAGSATRKKSSCGPRACEHSTGRKAACAATRT